jgi:hypothetical protein
MLSIVNLSVGIYGCIGLYSNDYQNYTNKNIATDDGLYTIVWWMVWIRIFPIMFILLLFSCLCLILIGLYIAGR